MFAIYKRELKSYYTGMIAPIFSAVLLVLVGVFTTATNLMGGYPNFEYALSSTLIIYLIIPFFTKFKKTEEERTNKK